MGRHDFTSKERAVAVEFARKDLHTYTRWMFLQRRGYAWRDNWHHRIVCDTLMRVYRGELTRVIFNIPPRYSKTEIAVVSFISWALGRDPDSEFIHASYSGTLAVNNSGNVKNLVQHEAYREVFPETRIQADAKAHWTTTKDGVMYATGAGGTITGFGAGKDRDGFGGAIVIDDPHKADEAGSEIVRAGVIDWYQSTLESRQNAPGRTPIILIMQRLHQDDLAGWLLGGGSGEQWHHVCLPAIQPDGTALWPAKHTIEQLRVMETAKPYHFAGQYGQRPAPKEGGIFKPDNIETIAALPAVATRWVRGWDLGATIDGDWTAGVKLGKLVDGRYVVADVVRLREGPDKRDAALKNTASADGKLVRASLPQDPGQAGKTQALALTRLLDGYMVHTSPESGDKITRAEVIASQVNAGNVLMLRGSWNDAFKEELRMFPNGTYDDQVDALSRANEALMTGVGKVEVHSPKGL